MVRSLKAAIPAPLLPVGRAVYHRLFRLHLRIRCWLSDLGRAKDYPPAMLRYRVSEDLSLHLFDYVGEGCAQLIANHLTQAGIDFHSATPRILDFGCGCARTLRWLLRTHPNAKYYGSDVDTEAIA